MQMRAMHLLARRLNVSEYSIVSTTVNEKLNSNTKLFQWAAVRTCRGDHSDDD